MTMWSSLLSCSCGKSIIIQDARMYSYISMTICNVYVFNKMRFFDEDDELKMYASIAIKKMRRSKEYGTLAICTCAMWCRFNSRFCKNAATICSLPWYNKYCVEGYVTDLEKSYCGI